MGEPKSMTEVVEAAVAQYAEASQAWHWKFGQNKGPVCHDHMKLAVEEMLPSARAFDSERAAGLLAALQTIKRWFGEFPATGLFVDDEQTIPVSYGCAYGSNGERDYMRVLAWAAVADFEAAAGTEGQSDA